MSCPQAYNALLLRFLIASKLAAAALA